MAIFKITDKRDLIEFHTYPSEIKAGDFLLINFWVMESRKTSTDKLPAAKFSFPNTGYQIITYIPEQKWDEVYPDEMHLYKKSFYVLDVEAVNQDSLKAILDSAKKNHEQLFELGSSLFCELKRMYMTDADINLGKYSPTLHAEFRKKPFELKPPLAKLLISCISQSYLKLPLYVSLSQYFIAIDAGYYLLEYKQSDADMVLNLMHKGVSSEKINLIAEQLLGE